jgi:hypothetical protein
LVKELQNKSPWVVKNESRGMVGLVDVADPCQVHKKIPRCDSSLDLGPRECLDSSLGGIKLASEYGSSGTQQEIEKSKYGDRGVGICDM